MNNYISFNVLFFEICRYVKTISMIQPKWSTFLPHWFKWIDLSIHTAHPLKSMDLMCLIFRWCPFPPSGERPLCCQSECAVSSAFSWGCFIKHSKRWSLHYFFCNWMYKFPMRGQFALQITVGNIQVLPFNVTRKAAGWMLKWLKRLAAPVQYYPTSCTASQFSPHVWICISHSWKVLCTISMTAITCSHRSSLPHRKTHQYHMAGLIASPPKGRRPVVQHMAGVQKATGSVPSTFI